MRLTLDAKKAVVDEVRDVASKAVSAVIAEYRGITSNDMNKLRSDARKAGIYLRVVRNTLARRALEGTAFSVLDERLVGPLFIALSSESPGDAPRLLKGFVKTFERLEVKAIAVTGQVYEASQLDMVASLPTKDEAIARLMAVMKAPIEKLVRTLAEPHAKLVRLLAAVQRTK